MYVHEAENLHISVNIIKLTPINSIQTYITNNVCFVHSSIDQDTYIYIYNVYAYQQYSKSLVSCYLEYFIENT